MRSPTRVTARSTPGAAREYRRYPAAADRIRVLENGFDEESFTGLSHQAAREPLVPNAVTLLHAGSCIRRSAIRRSSWPSRMAEAATYRPAADRALRAAGRDDLLQSAQRCGIERSSTLRAAHRARPEMVRADALLVLQAANCSEQIPTKLYEYLRARRPTSR
jgi:hypothetical protein